MSIRMTHLAIALGSALAVSCLAACGPVDPDDGDDNTGATLGGGEAVCGLTTDPNTGDLVLRATEANNYTFMSTLDIEETPVAAKQDLTIEWSGVTKDFSGHDVDPLADIDTIALILWKLSSQELAVKLNDDDLSQSDFIATVTLYTENQITSGNLLEFTEFGFEVPDETLLEYMDPNNFDPATHAYTVMAMKGMTLGKNTHMITAFQPDYNSTNTQITVDSSSAELSYTVQLANVQGVAVPASRPDIAIDWSTISTNAMGGEFDPTSITQVVVGRFDESIQELEQQFLDLDLIAEDLYWGEVLEGSNFSLEDTVTDDGRAFMGIDGTSTWLVGLRCGVCTNPAPWFLTLLKPCAMQQ